MFKGFVFIVKRKKTLHCGFKVRMGSDIKTVSACNQTWHVDDKTYEDMSEAVTCKRCLKILEKADEDGRVDFRRRK
jgi:hypothetical protein